jgi:microcystin-dependent protein
MSNEYVLGSIIMFAGNYALRGWAFCDGQLLNVSQYPKLFSILGTSYGGDGKTTFALPDLRGRVPVHRSAEMAIGSKGGEEAVKLVAAQIPAHKHNLIGGSKDASSAEVKGLYPAKAAANAYQSAPAGTELSRKAVGQAGGNQPHSNMQPFTCINFIINIDGFDTQLDPDAIIGEIRLVAFSKRLNAGSWLPCDGSPISISQNQALSAVIGTTFGGNGSTTFNLPDLRGRVPVDDGAGIGLTRRVLGQQGGESNVQLNINQMAGHDHVVRAAGTGDADLTSPAKASFGKAPGLYGAAENLVEFGSVIGVAGGNRPHNNIQPSLALNFVICVTGCFPSRN